MEEFEIKFLEVDVSELEEKLIKLGAKKVGEYNYRRVLLDYPDLRLDKEQKWLRLRTNGTNTTLTFKERIGVNSCDASASDEGMKEIEIEVESYEKPARFLSLWVLYQNVKKKINAYVIKKETMSMTSISGRKFPLT